MPDRPFLPVPSSFRRIAPFIATGLAIVGSPFDAHAAADSVVIISEVQYAPPTAESAEWIELVSLHGVDVDLSGWAITGGTDFTFPEGTVLEGRGRIVVASNPGDPALAGATVVGPFTRRLDNAGDLIELRNRNRRVMDFVEYGNDGQWPAAPDGSGATLSRRDEGSADNRPGNWSASTSLGGTPGRVNFPTTATPPTVSTLVALEDTWRYRDAAGAPPAGWQTPDFDDAAWPEGQAAFAAGQGGMSTAGQGLMGYWPLDSAAGTTVPNAVAGGPTGTRFGNAAWFADPTRGSVIRLDGSGSYIDAGADTIPQLSASDDFTWSFWAYSEEAANNDVVFGNRYSPNGSDWAPREFIKFTTSQFEWHHDGIGENIDYPDIPTSQWIHHAVVKDGTTLTYYRNGSASGSSTITAGLNNPQPLYFGGDRTTENWAGRLDEAAVWTKALPATSIAGLADGTLTPLTAPTGDGAPAANTMLAAGTTAHYFRKAFDFAGAPGRTSLQLRLLVDDGAVVYLNGTEIHRSNMPAGAVAHGTNAIADVDPAILGTQVSVPAAALRAGANVLAVEVHQAAGSEDMLFAGDLVATEQPAPPGGSDSSLAFSEVSGWQDADFRIELQNRGTSPVDLAGYQIHLPNGGTHAIASGTVAPGQFLVLDAAALGFQPASSEPLVLLEPDGSTVVDAVKLARRPRARLGDEWFYAGTPTFGQPNAIQFEDAIVINEIMYNGQPSPATPGSPGEFESATVVDYGAAWRYNESGQELGTTWETAPHPEGGDWKAGPGPLGWETSPPPIPFGTEVTQPVLNVPRVTTYYFETDFNLTPEQLASTTEVALTHLIDDGAIFYLNGLEILRFNMPAEPVNAATVASNGTDAEVIGPIVLPDALNLLAAGNNRLSVEVHQSTPASSDIVFGMKLDLVRQVSPPVPPQPPRESDEEWIELFNRGADPVDLGGWEFADGIDFTFPEGTTLAPGGFLVVAADAAELRSRHPGITVLGDFGGRLSGRGERILLVDASGNPADEVRFADGGRWPGAADAGGSSLELRDPLADNAVPESWAASDETAKSEWTTVRYRGRASNHENDPTRYNEFVLGLLDQGEILIDDISVVEDPDGSARQLIQNGDFSNGTTSSWRLIGTHRHAEVVSDSGNNALHLRTSGSSEHMHNHAETTLKAGGSFVTINASRDYEISFRAKWLSGSNQLHTRLYFNRLARTTLLPLPDTSGTPGRPNSTLEDNIGPSLLGAIHAPAVPAAGEPAVVSIQADDPDGIASLTLHYSVNGGNFTPVSMTPDPAMPGRFRSTVPGQAAAAKVQFFVEAVDARGAVSRFPAGGPDSGAIIPVEDGQADLDYGECQPNNFRIVLTPANTTFLHERTNVMSNDPLPCTIIYNEREIYYDCGVRLKGSQRGRYNDVRVGFLVKFGADQPFLGAHQTVAVDRSGAGDQFSQKEILIKHAIGHAGGIPGTHDDLIRIIAPRPQHTGSAMFIKSRFDDEFLRHQFDDGQKGTMWEYELIYYPTTTVGNDPEGLKIPNPDSVVGVPIRSLGDDKELYRWHWLIENNKRLDDYSGLMAAVTAIGLSGSQFLEETGKLLDIDQWLRAFAIQILFGIGDNYATGAQHNMAVYLRPSDGRLLYFPWDMDFTFSSGNTSSITPNGDLNKMLADPANRRAYLGHLDNILETTFNAAYMGPWATHYSCFLPREDLSGFVGYINTRASYVRNQITNQIPAVDFAITTPDSTEFPGSTATIEGDGWVNVRTIRLRDQSGVPRPVEAVWTDRDSWRILLPVAPGTNTLTLEALDFEGNVIATDSVEVTGSSDSEPAGPGNLAISEINYNPAEPSPAELQAGFTDNDDFEFIELSNVGPLPIDLTGLRFSTGIPFTVPDGTVVAPGQPVVVARNRNALRFRYPSLPAGTLIGEYGTADSGRLDNGGEPLEIVDALGVVVLRIEFDDQAPWPEAADGGGYTLTLRGLVPVGSTVADEPSAWRPSAFPNGTPGIVETVPFSGGDPMADADGNGIADLLDYAVDGIAEPAIIETFAGQSPMFGVRFRLVADDARLVPEWSSGLGPWSGDGTTHLGTEPLGDGTGIATWSLPAAAAAGPSLQVRFRITPSTVPVP